MVVTNYTGPHPDENVLAWINSVDDVDLYMSVVVIMEIVKGIGSAKRKLARYTDLSDLDTKQEAFSAFVRDHRDQFIPIDDEIAGEWGRLIGIKEKNIVDLLIAATALVKKYIVVTRNEKHFRASKVETVNPFNYRKATRSSI
jgi:predicted nucleic acid-binding protein